MVPEREHSEPVEEQDGHLAFAQEHRQLFLEAQYDDYQAGPVLAHLSTTAADAASLDPYVS